MVAVGFVWRWTGAQGEINRRDEFFCNFENEWQIKIKTKEPGGGGEGGREQDGPGTSHYARKQGSTKKRGRPDIGMSQARRSQVEAAISGQIWDNLTNKIIKDSNEL